MTLKRLLVAASAILAVSTQAKATTVTVAKPSATISVITATDALSSAPTSTSWVCFKDTSVAIQIVPASAASFAEPIVERSDVNPAITTANPVQPLWPEPEYGYPSTAYTENFHEAGIGWWRVRLTSSSATISMGQYLPTGAVTTSALPISVSMSGKGC